MSSKAWIIFAAVCVLLFGGLLVWSQRGKIDVSNMDTNEVLAASEDSGNIGDHVKGAEDAKVVLFEYGDFQCPGCAGVYPSVKSLEEKYGENLAVVFRNFPLTSIHPNARAASAAAEAAGLVGGNDGFWSMHDALFENQNAWKDASASDRTNLFKNYAQTIGLDVEKFEQALNDESSRINRKISFDQALGRKLDVTGTPSFYLNGEKLTEEQTGSEEAFEKTITDALKEAGVKVKEDTTEE